MKHAKESDMIEEFRNWFKIAKLLNLEVEIIETESLGLSLPVDRLVCFPEFGASKGMLIIPEGIGVLKFSDLIIEKGFGYSVVEPPSETSEDNLESLTEMFRDWGRN